MPMRDSSIDAGGHRVQLVADTTRQAQTGQNPARHTSQNHVKEIGQTKGATQQPQAQTSGNAKQNTKVKCQNTTIATSQSTATAKPNPSSNIITILNNNTSSSNNNNNFEYDDNEWDIGIGNLIIDLDADIEKTKESPNTVPVTPVLSTFNSSNNLIKGLAMSANTSAGSNAGGKTATAAAASKMSIEHSSTVDKGLKMKIKRTKPGTKTSEAKHEIVKSNENGVGEHAEHMSPSLATTAVGVTATTASKGRGHPPGGSLNQASLSASASASGPVSSVTGAVAAVSAGKRGSNVTSHSRRSTDKVNTKHGASENKTHALTPSHVVSKPGLVSGVSSVTTTNAHIANTQTADMNGANIRVSSVSSAQTLAASRTVFPASTGPGPPSAGVSTASALSTTGHNATHSSGTTLTATKPLEGKVATTTTLSNAVTLAADASRGISPAPKRIKCDIDTKEIVDKCIGTSVGTITEPECLGPCEPGTSVTLEGIVWHETEGGVLVVNVTWRGKTYVGTLLDCTRHDWAPPRFCDSPTEELDSRTPKGRGKRGRAAAAAAITPSNDLLNFTETRSSVHSKLRNGGAKGRGGRNTNNSSNNGSTTSGTSSPTQFVSPRTDGASKRKGRNDDETPPPGGKKTRISSNVPASPASTGSPPASPVLLECPEPNCSKKYKHINGLKYHQSHAHGGSTVTDDDDTKDVTSMSENDESNIEAPSPASTPVKSPPEKVDGTATSTTTKKDELPVPARPESASTPSTPKSRPVTPSHILSQPPPEIAPAGTTPVDSKNVVKPGVLRFGPPPPQDQEFSFANKPIPQQITSSPITANSSNTTVNAISVAAPDANASNLFPSQPSPAGANCAAPTHTNLTSPQNVPVNVPSSPGHNSKLPFKVKPTAALMPSDDKKPNIPNGAPSTQPTNVNKTPPFKKKRKSPDGSPQDSDSNQFGDRDDVQSPAYSDISDDNAPEPEGEKKNADPKKPETPTTGPQAPGQPIPHAIPGYGLYPFYGQPPYLVPPIQQTPTAVQDPKGPKDPLDKTSEKPAEKDPKKDGPNMEFAQQKVMPPQHYYPYGYMQGYPYNIDPAFGPVPIIADDKNKDDRLKDAEHNKQPPAQISQSPLSQNPAQNPAIQIPTPTKVKMETVTIKSEKHQGNDNHAIIKESIEMKNQMNPYMYSRNLPPGSLPHQHQAQQMQHGQLPPGAHHLPPHHPGHHPGMQQNFAAAQHAAAQQAAAQQAAHQRDEEMRRYYAMYPDQSPQAAANAQQAAAHQAAAQQAHQAAQHQAAQQQQQQQQQQHQQQQQQQRRKEEQRQQNIDAQKGPPKLSQSPASLNKHSSKDKLDDNKKDKEIKQEGVKPTMETQGPPPPPTSQYAYIHPGYMQSPAGPYNIPFDPNHPMYRSMLMHSPYGANPYLHPQIPRYHAPEDLSRAPQGPPTKALDLLQHHANQYYTSHKIHELQERALKSPTPKTTMASPSPSQNPSQTAGGAATQQVPHSPAGLQSGGQASGQPPSSQAVVAGSGPGSGSGKQSAGEGKDSRSPPPQRHVHTHHHTHVGLGYPILAGQYPAPYGAAVLASQQAAAVTVINPYPPK